MREVNKKFIILVFFVIVLVIVWILVPCVGKAKLNAKIQAEMQSLSESPAAQYCENNWWNLDISVDELSGVYGMCNFDDWSVCEVVEYFRWECLSLTEKNETEASYCSDWVTCDSEEPDDDLGSRIDDMNNIENLDGEVSEELLDDDLDNMDIDSLYEYYESEFTNSWSENWNSVKRKIKWWEDEENQLSSACDWVWWTILWDKCYLSNGVEIVF